MRFLKVSVLKSKEGWEECTTIKKYCLAVVSELVSCKTKNGMNFGDKTVQDWKFKCWWFLNCGFFHVVRESLSLISLGCFVGFLSVCWWTTGTIVQELLFLRNRGNINEKDPSPCALVAVLSQVKITAGRMGLGAGQYNDLLFFLLWMGPGDCFQVKWLSEKLSKRNVKVPGNKLTFHHVFLLQFKTLCCFAYKWFPEPLVFQSPGVCPS